jgi:hypothetical protein
MKISINIFFALLITSTICAQEKTFAPRTDNLPLKSGWNWLSFPRMERYGDEYSPTVPVLERLDVFPCDLNIYYKHIFNNKSYDIISGEWTGELNDLQTTQGYKMRLDINTLLAKLDLHGAKLDPATEMHIVPGQENWVGYFVEYPQYPKDCFDEATWANLTKIQTQYWTMSKGLDGWWVSGKLTPFEYGDLVILKCNAEQDFSWIENGAVAATEDLEKPTYFTYGEQSSYLPVYVEFDASSEVREIAVTVEGEVKGAAVRQTGDTIVEVNAYLQGTPPDAPLDFETWNGYKSDPVQKEGYTVYDPGTKKMEKRVIYAGEHAEYHLVSLKTGETYTVPNGISNIKCLPNPFGGKTAISFRLNEGARLWLEIYGINGQKEKTLLEGELPGGFYTTDWDGTNESGAKVKKGVYFYRLRTSNGTVASGKIVVL